MAWALWASSVRSGSADPRVAVAEMPSSPRRNQRQRRMYLMKISRATNARLFPSLQGNILPARWIFSACPLSLHKTNWLHDSFVKMGLRRMVRTLETPTHQGINDRSRMVRLTEAHQGSMICSQKLD